MTRASDTAKLLGAGGTLLGALSVDTISENTSGNGVNIDGLNVKDSGISGGQIGGRRNIVINGAMQVAQRATSVTGLGDDNDENYPTVDRFEINGNAGAGRFTMTQEAVTDLPGFPECIKLDCTTADTSIAAAERLFIQTKIEGQDLQATGTGTADAKPITLSFYAKASASFKFVAALLNVDNDRYAGSTFDVTTSWQRFIITFPADVDDGSSPFDNDNADSLHIRFFLHAGANYTSGTLSSTFANAVAANTYDSNAGSFYSSTDNNFFLTGVQLEVGSVATPFEHRSFGEELQLCKRYFNQIGGQTAYQNIIQTMWISDNTAVSPYYHRPALRATPTIAKLQNYSSLGPGTIGQTLSTDQNGLNSVQFGFSGGSGGTSGISVVLRGNNNSGVYITFDAEL